MYVKDRYSLLSKAVRIANTANIPYVQRLKYLAKLLASSFSAHSASIYLCDEKRRTLISCVSTASPRPLVSCHIPLGEGVAGRSASSGCAVTLHPESLHPDELLKGAEATFFAIPIGDERALLGVCVLGITGSDVPAGNDLELMQDILVVIAGIIQRISLSAGSQRRIANLTILSELGSLLNRSVAPDSLASIILESCHRQSGACCTVLRLESESGHPPVRMNRVRAALRRNLSSVLGIEERSFAKVRHNSTPLLICDLVSDEELPPSYVCVPLVFESRILGSLTFFGKRRPGCGCQNFTEEDRDLFESMATLIANAIAGAANYQNVLRLSQENDHKLKELGLLYRLSNTMLSTIRLNKLMHLILSALTSGENPLFERAMLFLSNERAGVMQGMLGVTHEISRFSAPFLEPDNSISSRWDISEAEMQKQQKSDFSSMVRSSRIELSRSKNMASRAVLERKLVFVPDTSRDRRVDREFVERFGIASFAAMPLLAKDKVLGVVVVDNPSRSRQISGDDLRFLELFTNQAGIAIENSLLYNKIEDTNRRLRDAQERLLHGERLATIGEMAAGIAHELKNPLVSVGGFARRLQRKLPKGSVESEYAATIVGEVARLEKMLTDILSFSRKSTLCYSVCTMQEIVDEALAVISHSLEESRISVIRQEPSKALSFLGDCQQLKQVFINLFCNAQEAMQGAGELKITLAAGRFNGRESVTVKVADTGGGIPLPSLGNIFNPFFTTKESGTGLGLPIANRIVTNHGGKIQVNNYPGVGVEFTVIIPAEPPLPPRST